MINKSKVVIKEGIINRLWYKSYMYIYCNVLRIRGNYGKNVWNKVIQKRIIIIIMVIILLIWFNYMYEMSFAEEIKVTTDNINYKKKIIIFDKDCPDYFDLTKENNKVFWMWMGTFALGFIAMIFIFPYLK